MYLAGRGAGKTRSGAEWIREQVKGGEKFLGLIAPTASDIRKVMIEGSSGLLSCSWDDDVDVDGREMGRPDYEPSKSHRLTWKNGAVAHCFSAEEPDRLRGPQHGKLWCFIAGTKVAVRNGERNIEELNPGDLVMTRKGLRRVIANSCRRAIVGRVGFDNGNFLVGTGEHPVYNKCGWTRLDRLKTGDVVCAINASNGMARPGIAITDIMSAAKSAAASNEDLHYIAKNGKNIAGLFQKALIFITKMKIQKIINLAILLASNMVSTSHCISLQSRFAAIGQSFHFSTSIVSGAVKYLSENALIKSRDVKIAIGRMRGLKEENCGNVNIVVKNSIAFVEPIAVSVASTWQQEAEQFVYCLKIEDEPEYFANGILVHNCDEVAAWQYAQETWDMAMFGLRLGVHPQVMISTTPRPIPIIRELMRNPNTLVTRSNTYANMANLAKSFIDRVVARYAGTRLGRQELEAELIEEMEGALWSRDTIQKCLVENGKPPDFKRVVVAIDPAITENPTSNLTGIVGAGLGVDNKGYVLRDYSDRYSPHGWASKAVEMFDELKADRIVAEGNQGGDMVRHTIQSVRANIPISIVHASRSKQARAEPVAALYEQGRVRHIEPFPEMEDQMCTWEPLSGDPSPDRLDAMVWALTNLMLDGVVVPFVSPIVMGSLREIPGQ